MIRASNIEKLIKLSLISLAFTPLVVTNSTLFPFTFGKAIFIRFIIAIIGILFVAGVLLKKTLSSLDLADSKTRLLLHRRSLYFLP